MATWDFELQSPPTEPRDLELWLQHAAGRILFEDVRGYALERIDPGLSDEALAAARKGIHDAVYGLMMVLDGVTGALADKMQQVELATYVRLVDRESSEVLAEVDLGRGDGMCMAYHGWVEGDYGESPIVKPKSNG